MIVVSIYDGSTEWIGTAVLNDDELAEHRKLIEAAEQRGLRWESVRPDSPDDLLRCISEVGPEGMSTWT